MNIFFRIINSILSKDWHGNAPQMLPQEIEDTTMPYRAPAYEDIKSNLTARVSCSYWIHEITNASDALVCSIDANGYLREKALRYLVANYHPSYASRILLRLSDWVEQVREISEKWFVDHVDEFTLRELDKNSDVFCFVFRKPAVKDRYVYAKFGEFLQCKMAKCQKAHFYKLSLRFRRLIYEILQDQNVEILDFLKTDPAPVLMAIPFGEKFESVPSDYIDAVINSNNWAVRSKLYDYYSRKNIRPPDILLKESLTAKSYAIRSMAKFYLSMSDDELAAFYRTQPYPLNLYVSDLRRESDAEFLSDAFLRGNSKAREIVCEYIIEKCSNIVTQDIMMELYFGGSNLRRKFLRGLASGLEATTLIDNKMRILSEANNEPWMFLDLVARISKWKYLTEVAILFSETSIENTEFRCSLERHYYATFGSGSCYSRDPNEKNVALDFVRSLPEKVLPAQLLKRIEFDAK